MTAAERGRERRMRAKAKPRPPYLTPNTQQLQAIVTCLAFAMDKRALMSEAQLEAYATLRQYILDNRI